MTGGSGLLGTELQKYLKCDAPPHGVMNINRPETFLPDKYDTIIHCAAYTDVAGAEKDPYTCFYTNYLGTSNLVNHYKKARFVHISTDYVYEPVNVYTYSKVEAERVVRSHKDHLIIRTLFKPRPFPFPKAFTDQYTTGDYVDIIAPLIISEIENNQSILADVGTESKTIYELAKRSNPKVGKMKIKDITNVKLPYDTRP